MAQLLLINPKVKPSKRRKSKGVKAVAKIHRSAAQKAATRKLVALNKAKKRGKSVVKAKHKKRRRRNPIAKVAKRRIRRARNPIANVVRRHKRRRHNPIAAKLGLGNIAKIAMSSAVAAGGALSLDLAWGFLPLPDMVKLGPMRHVAKGAGAIALGMLAGFVVKRETANALATGAMTVVMYNAARELLANVAPQIALGEYVSVSQPEQLGEYLSEIPYAEGVDGLMVGDNDYSMQGMTTDFE